MTREDLYVAVSRGREANHVYIPVEYHLGVDAERAPESATDADTVLRDIVGREGAELSATETMRAGDGRTGPAGCAGAAVRGHRRQGRQDRRGGPLRACCCRRWSRRCRGCRRCRRAPPTGCGRTPRSGRRASRTAPPSWVTGSMRNGRRGRGRWVTGPRSRRRPGTGTAPRCWPRRTGSSSGSTATTRSSASVSTSAPAAGRGSRRTTRSAPSARAGSRRCRTGSWRSRSRCGSGSSRTRRSGRPTPQKLTSGPGPFTVQAQRQNEAAREAWVAARTAGRRAAGHGGADPADDRPAAG